MKILIYSDLHCSLNSSILPMFSDLCDFDEKFSTRLNMIIKTGIWLSELAKKEKVYCIINGGDTFDSTVVKAEELEAIVKFFDQFSNLNIPQYVLVGNHEKVNEKFNASEILSGYQNVTVVSKPEKLNDYVSVLPYVDAAEITGEMLKEISNKILVSHIDIQGSCLRDSYILDSGVNPELLAEYFEFTANGHLHTAEKLETSKNQVWNIGGVSSISFVDNQEYLPSCVIYDTKTNTFERYENPHSILFRRYTINTLKELMSILTGLKKSKYSYALMVKYANYDQKLDIQKLLDKTKNVIAYKLVNVYVDLAKADKAAVISEVTSVNIQEKFEEFLDSVDLKYEKKDYLKVLERCEDEE